MSLRGKRRRATRPRSELGRVARPRLFWLRYGGMAPSTMPSSLQQPHGDPDATEDQDGEEGKYCDDAAEGRRPYFGANDGLIAGERLDLGFVVWVATITRSYIGVSQFKTFGTATATIAIGQAAFRAFFEFLGSPAATGQTRATPGAHRSRRGHDGLAAWTSD